MPDHDADLCWSCEEPIDFDHWGVSADGYEFCENCYLDHCSNCSVCGDLLHNDTESGLVVVIWPNDRTPSPWEMDDASRWVPGTYHVHSWPIEHGPIIGESSIPHGAMRRIGPPPAERPDEGWSTGGYVCIWCSAKALGITEEGARALLRNLAYGDSWSRDRANPDAWMHG